MADLNLINNVLEIGERLGSKEQMLGKGLNMPFNALNSGSRKIMFSTQMDHRVDLINPEVPLIGTGFENRFGEHASSFVKSDSQYLVIAKIEKFSHLPGHHYFLILKKLGTDEYHMIERVMYEHITESYGYLYNTKYMDDLKVGSYVQKDDVVRKSRSYDEYDNRMDGVNLITTYISNEDSKEDGIIVSQSAAEKLACPLIKKINVVINDNDIPLNMYGTDTVYKIMPDIGDNIKQGIVCAMRREKKEESLFSQSLQNLKTLMMSDDKIISKGQILDIDISCNNPEMLKESYYSTQLKYYYENNIRFMTEVVNVIKPIIEDNVNICSYELQKLYYNSKKIVVDGKKYIKDKPFSNTILTITVLQKCVLEKGDKISNRYGGKGVVSKVRPDHLMPKLKDTGECVEVIFNSGTSINRENIGQLFETSLNHISNRMLHYMKDILDSDECAYIYEKLVNLINVEQGSEITALLDRLDPEDRDIFFNSVVSDKGMMFSLRPISDPMNIDMLAEIYKEFPYIKQHKVVVPQRDSNGNIRYLEARRRLTCGKQYIYRLKQYAEEKFSATSLSSTNIRNENSRSSSKKSNKTIFTKTPVRFGEMETGNLLHLGAENVIVNLLLYSASPKGRRLAEDLLIGNPFDVDIKLDDQSTNRGVEILNAYLLTMGLRLKFKKNPKKRKCPIKFAAPVSMPCNRTPIRFINADDKMGQLYLDNFGKKSKSPIKFVPISFIGGKR